MSSDSGDESVRVRFQTVDEGCEGQRIDNYLQRELKGVPKSRIYRILRKGEVRVNKARVKPEYKLKSGDLVRIPPVRVAPPSSTPSVSEGLAKRLREGVLFEDAGLLILNKPSGLAVHGGSGVQLGLIEALRALRPEQKFLELVHRLDRDTSGCVMIAKKRSVLRALHEKLRNGDMDKRYLALVAGHWSKRRRLVNLPLDKNHLQSGERMVRVSMDGKEALTEFSVVRQFAETTLVEAKPITGRTHQIRVHALAAGHPLLGDEKYGDAEMNQRYREFGLKRLFLHAHALELEVGGKRIAVEAPLGDELEGVLKRLADQ